MLGCGVDIPAPGANTALAGEILSLAEQARRSVQDSPGQSRRIQIAATNVAVEHIGPLIESFTARDAGLEIAVESVPGDSFAERLEHRRADVTLGPRPGATYSSHAAAIAAAAAGEGILLTLTHSVLDEVRRRALTRLDVRGTPIVEIWHASTLGLGRALPAALALAQFATTAQATQALSTGRAGTVATRVRPNVHVTLWSSMAADLDAGRQ